MGPWGWVVWNVLVVSLRGEVMEGGKGKFELFEIFAKRHELGGSVGGNGQGSRLLGCVLGQGLVFLDFGSQEVKEGEESLGKPKKGLGGVVCLKDDKPLIVEDA